uniref:Uncharacterized protein n=1 Tax=Rhizophora mucronata TaxID=61149 RepID=A0A2P2INE8_RHIMU
MTGGDDDKLSYLIKNLGLKLMGSDALVDGCSSLIFSIASAQRGRSRNRIVAGQHNSGAGMPSV